MRCLVDVALAVVVWAVFMRVLVARWNWYEQYGSFDYVAIGLVFLLFVLAVYVFDRMAEEKGWIVHHWWDY